MTNNNICFKPAPSLLTDRDSGSSGNLRPNWTPEGGEILLPLEQQGKFGGRISAAVRHGGPPAEFGLSCVDRDRFQAFHVDKKKQLAGFVA